MKNFKLVLLVMSVFAFSANASLLTTSEVGSVDRFLDSDTLTDSGEQTEKDWFSLETGLVSGDFDFSKIEYNDDAIDTWTQLAGDSDLFALSVDPSVSYFILKLGNGNTTPSHYLFENIDNLNYLVIDLADFDSQLISDLERISHLDTFSSAVPEPSIIALLGLGLFGLGLARRKAK